MAASSGSSSSGESGSSSSEPTYAITISDSITNGTVTASKTKAEAGEEITLTVTPSDGYALDSLTVKDAGGSDVTVTANKFTMPAKNVTVSAVFKVATVTYSVTVDGSITGGTVASDKTTGISAGTTVTLTITPATGKMLDALTVKDASNNAVATTAVVAGTTYTFAMPEGNVSVTATFKNVYSVTVDGAITGGTVASDKTTGISAGTTVTLTITPDGGKVLDALTVKDASNNAVTTTAVAAGTTYTFVMPEGNVSVTATFKAATYSVNVDGAITGGTVASDKTTDISSGSTVTLTITPATGKVIDALTVKDASNNAVATTAVVAGTSYTFTMPESNVTVTATFADPYSTGLLGDIVLSDGKYITATNYEKYSEQLTQTAVAVIFDVSGSNKKGVGLRQGTSKAWAANGTTGYTTNISTLAATKDSGSNANDAVFSGATDGSGSLAKFRTAVGVADGTALSSTDYPAWAFVESYATTASLTGTYASGWYMPSIAELCKLYQAKTDVNNALSKIIGATQLSTNVYWSSSQSASGSHLAWDIVFRSGNLSNNDKLSPYSVCAVRAFN